MASTMNVTLLVVALIAAATVLPGTQATDFVVGDATGWQIPPTNGAGFYSNWAAKYNFSVGDVLAFNFATGVHDLATVSKVVFDACDTANTLTLNRTGPVNFTLSTPQEYHFICTIGQHCSQGQKLAINVTSGPPSPPGVLSPPPPGVLSPPPPSAPSSASSLAATSSLILMTIASTIFYLF